MPMSFGSFALEGFIPDFDATVVTRVLQAGGTIIGKNVMNGLSGGFGTRGALRGLRRPLQTPKHQHPTRRAAAGAPAAPGAGPGGKSLRRRPGRAPPHSAAVLRGHRPQ